MATTYNILDTRDKTELTNKMASDKTELQGNIDALGAKHNQDKTELQSKIDGLKSSKADKTELASHNTSGTAHNDIRTLIDNLNDRLNTLADSDDDTLDQMSEIVAYIEDNRDLIEQITTNKVSVSDIVNNLTTNVSNKPLSAAMGVELKRLFDVFADWAKQPNKPTYTATEVGADPAGTAVSVVHDHNIAEDAHQDIRASIAAANTEIDEVKGMIDDVVVGAVAEITNPEIDEIWSSATGDFVAMTKAQIDAMFPAKSKGVKDGI